MSARRLCAWRSYLLLCQYPTERLFLCAKTFTGAASGDPMSSIGRAAAAIDLDRVTGGGFVGVTVTGYSIFIVLIVTGICCDEPIGMTQWPRCVATALNQFSKCLSLRFEIRRRQLYQVTYRVDEDLREAGGRIRRACRAESYRLGAGVTLIESRIVTGRQSN